MTRAFAVMADLLKGTGHPIGDSLIKPFESKAIFSWQIPSVLKGEPNAFANLLSLAGFEAVYLKVADGAGVYGVTGITNELISALRAKNISIIGWGFNYGLDWKGEAKIGAAQVNRWGLDGYIWDIESRYESTPNAVQNAYNMLAVFRQEVARPTPTAFCSWAYWRSRFLGSEIHPIGMLQAFMSVCDYGMPMQYWGGNLPAGAVSYLNGSLEQWRKYTDKPLIPAGRAYNGDGGEVNALSVIAYEQAVRDAGCKGISWWELDQAQPRYHADVWDALSLMRGFRTDAPPVEPPVPGELKTITVTKTVQVQVTTTDPNTSVTVEML